MEKSKRRRSYARAYYRLSVLCLAAMVTARLILLMIDVIQLQIQTAGAFSIPASAAILVFTGWELKTWTGQGKEKKSCGPTSVTAAERRLTPEDIAKLRAPDFCGRIGYPAYALQNNNANIRRIRGRIAELKKRTENTPEGWEFDGGRVVVNTAENRLQIIFDGKPDADIRTELKGEGFRWAPSQGAWQRQLTDNAMRAARRLKCIAPQV